MKTKIILTIAFCFVLLQMQAQNPKKIWIASISGLADSYLGSEDKVHHHFLSNQEVVNRIYKGLEEQLTAEGFEVIAWKKAKEEIQNIFDVGNQKLMNDGNKKNQSAETKPAATDPNAQKQMDDIQKMMANLPPEIQAQMKQAQIAQQTAAASKPQDNQQTIEQKKNTEVSYDVDYTLKMEPQAMTRVLWEARLQANQFEKQHPNDYKYIDYNLPKVNATQTSYNYDITDNKLAAKRNEVSQKLEADAYLIIVSREIHTSAEKSKTVISIPLDASVFDKNGKYIGRFGGGINKETFDSPKNDQTVLTNLPQVITNATKKFVEIIKPVLK